MPYFLLALSPILPLCFQLSFSGPQTFSNNKEFSILTSLLGDLCGEYVGWGRAGLRVLGNCESGNQG